MKRILTFTRAVISRTRSDERREVEGASGIAGATGHEPMQSRDFGPARGW